MPVVLFHNESVDVTHTIRLNQSAVSFKRIEILYKTNVGDYSTIPNNVNYHSTTIYNPNGKRVSLFSTVIPDNTKEVYLGFKEVDINGIEIKTHKTGLYHTGRINIAKDSAYFNGDFVGITTVLGFYV